MKGTKAAGRYAKALLELAEEKNVLANVYQDVNYLQSVVTESNEFKLFLKNPIIHSSKKKAIFEAVFGQFEPLTLSFINLMTTNGRENILLDIASSFVDQYKAKNGIVPVTIVSAHTLDAKVKKDILAKIQQTIKGEIELVEKINASLIGGFIVQMGDTQIDASVASQFKNLKQRLTQ